MHSRGLCDIEADNILTTTAKSLASTVLFEETLRKTKIGDSFCTSPTIKHLVVLSMQKPSISKKAFWDVPFDKIDYEKNALQVMEKVFNYGDWNDQISIMKFYGLPRIKK